MDIATYLERCRRLAASIYYYSKVDRMATLRWYQLNRGELITCQHSEFHPYHLHLQGLKAAGDGDLPLLSLDTQTLMDFSQIKQHPRTEAHFRQDYPYRQGLLDTWGPFAYQRALGLLYPQAYPEQFKHGQIIAYDTTLVEPFETSLMADVQDWLYTTLHRWTNSGYVGTDRLYAAGLRGIISAHQVFTILSLRDARCLTQEAHSFHIEAYLSDYGLASYLPYLNTVQQFSFYKHLPWLIEHQGQQQAYAYVKEVLELDPQVKVVEYQAYSQSGLTQLTYGPFTQYVSEDVIAESLQQPLALVDQAFQQGTTLDNLPLLDVNYQPAPVPYLHLQGYALGLWGYFSQQGFYTEMKPITLSTGEQRLFTPYQAFLYYVLSLGYTTALPLHWVPLPTTEPQPFPAIPWPTLTTDNFIGLVEQGWAQWNLYKVWVDTAPAGETVNRLAVMLRAFGSTQLPLPDKTLWLAEQQLPPAESSVLTQLWDTFTQYAHSYTALEQTKPAAYRNLLRQLTSTSLHPVSPQTPTVTAVWVGLPVFTVIGVV